MGSIPMTFLLFIIGSVVLFYNLLREFSIRQKMELTFAYIFLISAMIFTRFSNESIFNGENFVSMFVYYLGVFVFVYFLFRIYSKDSRSEKKMEKINFSYILLFSLFLLGIFSARGAIRLVMVLAPIASIFIGYIIIESFVKFKESNKESASIKGVFFILILIISIFSLVSNYREITAISYNMVPTSYNQQWQKAMSWVREETPQNSVFGHWWDYGYWVQSIGNRATVLDGGNAITFWNYYMGRLVLTGDNQDDALEFLYAHNTTHLLIDSSDIGKYGAFSIIGSDENFDRYSWISTMLIDEAQTQENSDSMVYVYTSGIVSDEDLIIYEGNNEVLLPGKKTLIIGSVLTYNKEVKTFVDQPYIVAFYNGKQYQVKVKNIYVQDKMIEFDEGIDATLYVFPSIVNSAEGGRINDIGAIMYLSPRVMEGMLAQKYILNDPYDRFSNFKLVHVESSEIVNMIKTQGLSSSEFIYYGNTVQGPIKIWEIEYSGDEEFKQEYLETDSSKYLNWDL
jgi:asparagine N-glycosylation enzyme membrane subunit Stt3